MSTSDLLFKVGGALIANSPYYIERESDKEMIQHLSQMDYVLVIEPRQQGKTSLINRLMGTQKAYIFCYVDMNCLGKSCEKKWYEKLCTPILRRLNDLELGNKPGVPDSSDDWPDFLLQIGENAQKSERSVVIILDEIGAAKFSWCENFFTTTRAVYNNRQAEPAYNSVTFIFSGAFNTRELITDPQVSPFNIAARVRLRDFDLNRTRLLVNHLDIPEQERNEITTRIQYWANGQPYLTQFLCQYLSKEKKISAHAVDKGVENLLSDDLNHLPRIIESLNNDGKSKNYVIELINGKVEQYMAGSYSPHTPLELFGVIKPDENNICKIKNRIYERVLKNSLISQEKEENMSAQFEHGYALLIGISDYKSVRKLPKTVIKDAQDIYDLLTAKEHCGYIHGNTHKLLDKEATANNIRNEMKWLAQSVNEESTALIFFSGHGGKVSDGNEMENYLIPYDCDLSNIKDSSISGNEWTTLLQNIKAGKLVVLFDCCHSGGIGDIKNLTIYFKTGLDENYYEQLQKGKGRVIIASSRSDEVSLVLSGMNNSLFTYFLLKALRGEEIKSEDGLIKIFEVFDYISKKVPSKASQHPIFKGAAIEENFPIALVAGGKHLSSDSIIIPPKPASIDKKTLREKIVDAFSNEELEILCANIEQDLKEKGKEINLTWDGLGGNTKENKVLKLIETLDRRGWLKYLIDEARRERENII